MTSHEEFENWIQSRRDVQPRAQFVDEVMSRITTGSMRESALLRLALIVRASRLGRLSIVSIAAVIFVLRIVVLFSPYLFESLISKAFGT